MITRTGKISQLPKSIRDELNHRLQNGKQGPELLAWLNELPEVKELITTRFDHHPINRQNLTEWRRGGYEDWLQHQEREWRIQRLTEEGLDLEKHELKEDAFEHSARFALAELMADFDGLHQLKGHDRFQRLCALTRQLTRLQDAFNRSRWSALAWTRWNERFFGPAHYDRRLTLAEKDAPTPHLPASQNSAHSPQIKPIQTNSTTGGDPPQDQNANQRPWIIRNPDVHKTCGCVCKQCQSRHSNYSYEEALADQKESKRLGTLTLMRGQTAVYLRPIECHCPCPEHAPSAPEPGRVALPRDPILAVRQDRHEPQASDESSAQSTALTPQPGGAPPSPAPAALSIQPPPKSTSAQNPESRNTQHATRSPVTPSNPVNPIAPITPAPLPYDSMKACLQRISLLEAQSRALQNDKRAA